jgi:catechol 2,3-dioxygenase-like lactoylglutathione lyase family enzyme
MQMRVLGYTWAGVRTTDLKSTARFFADTLGFSLLEQREGLALFEMPSGQLFEVFGSESRYYELHAGPVLGFQVEDVRAARRELESAGVEFITDVLGDESEAWTYFHGPDNYVYELWQTQRPLMGLPCRTPQGAGQ